MCHVTRLFNGFIENVFREVKIIVLEKVLNFVKVNYRCCYDVFEENEDILVTLWRGRG